MNAVARRLRVLGIPVLMPDTFVPHSLSGARTLQYSFIAKAAEVYAVQPCLFEILNEEGKRREEQLAANALLGDINAFLASVFGAQLGSALKSDQAKGPEHSSSAPVGEQAEAKISIPFSASHLASVLTADLLAKELKMDPSTGNPLVTASQWKHILWLKALESGGSVTKTGGFLHSEVWYSGGAVGTYLLFDLKGKLECSGTFHDYGGPVRATELLRGPPQSNVEPVLQQGCEVPQPGGKTGT